MSLNSIAQVPDSTFNVMRCVCMLRNELVKSISLQWKPGSRGRALHVNSCCHRCRTVLKKESVCYTMDDDQSGVCIKQTDFSSDIYFRFIIGRRNLVVIIFDVWLFIEDLFGCTVFKHTSCTLPFGLSHVGFTTICTLDRVRNVWF